MLKYVCVCVCRTAGAHITVNGKECLNLATLNFLGLLENNTVKVYSCLYINNVVVLFVYVSVDIERATIYNCIGCCC